MPLLRHRLARKSLIVMMLMVLFDNTSLHTQQRKSTSRVEPTASSASVQKGEGGYNIRANVDLVILHTTVIDGDGRFVPDLRKENFRVFEDRIEQKLSLFSPEDVPVTMGLVIDNSGSMREKRAQVVAAAMSFVQTSNPQDEIFVVNFNDKWYLDLKEDFTSDLGELYQALSRIDASAGTALYDAVLLSLSHIKKGHKDKKVLLVITDGDDDASRASFAQTVETAEESRATIYTIGLFSRSDQEDDIKMVQRSKKALKTLAEATGGVAYFPDEIGRVDLICTKIAREIREQYTLGYYPTNTARDGKFRVVRVRVEPPKGKGKLIAHTRPGYYPVR